MPEFRGFVRWFNSAKGYGFLGREGGPDVFVHYSSIQSDGYRALKEAEAVEFDVIEGKQGKQADNVRRIPSGAVSGTHPNAAVLASASGHTGNSTDPGMELRDLLADKDFARRPVRARDIGRQLEAMRRLTNVFSQGRNTLLQELVDLAVEFCNADSAGVSLEEAGPDGELRFRWVAVAGTFARYIEGVTPRFFSPCGTCMDRGAAQLYRVTQPFYDALGVQADDITDGMLIPWSAPGVRGTIWAVAHKSSTAFDIEDYVLLNGLAGFVGMALKQGGQQETNGAEFSTSSSSALVNELAHEINTPLQNLINTLDLARNAGAEATPYIEQASEEVRTLSALVAKLLSVTAGER